MNNYTKQSGITEQQIAENRHLFSKGKMQRIPSILFLRLRGYTLAEIGKKFEVTRDRIHQQEAKGVEVLKVYGSTTSEDPQ